MAMKKCPVCGEEIKGKGVTVDAGGKAIEVCCEGCASKVRENPAAFKAVAS